MKKFSLVFLIMIFSFGCITSEALRKTEKEDTQNPESISTITSESTQTATNTSTIEPTKTTTLTPTITPIPYSGSVVISPENIDQIVEISSFGSGNIRNTTWSPDGKILVGFNRFDDILRLWKVDGGEELFRIEGNFTRAAFSMDGKLLALESSDNTIHLWDVTSGKQIGSISNSHVPQFFGSCISFSPDGRLFAYLGSNGNIKFWDIENEIEVNSFVKHSDQIVSFTFSPDGLTAASCSDNIIKIWDVETGLTRHSLLINENTSSLDHFYAHLAYSPDGALLATAANIQRGTMNPIGEYIGVWDVESGDILHSFTDETIYAMISFSPNGKLLVVKHSFGTSFYETAQGALVITIEDSYFSTFSPDGKTIAMDTSEGGIALYGIP